MDKILVLYTMKGCPWCDLMKKKLNECGITFHALDIESYKNEYDLFVKATNNEFLPAFMIVETKGNNPKSSLFAPSRDFDEIDQGVKIIKEYFKK